MMLFPAKLRLAAVVMATAVVVAGATVQYAATDEAAPAKAPELDAKFIKMAPLPKKLLAGQVVPRSRTNVTLAGGLPLSYLSYIAGSCFDKEENLLYVYGVLSKGSIHAYRVKDAGSAR